MLADSNGQDDLLSAIQAELADLKKQGATRLWFRCEFVVLKALKDEQRDSLQRRRS